jgi:hypothetical protein
MIHRKFLENEYALADSSSQQGVWPSGNAITHVAAHNLF